jgi:mannonate dehydratase
MRLGVGGLPRLEDQTLQLLQQFGVENIIMHVPELRGERYWEFQDLVRLRTRAEASGMKLEAIENIPGNHYDKIREGKPGRDEQIEYVSKTIRNIGRAGIPILGYHFMLNSVWRTGYNPVGRGGARVTVYHHDQVANAPLSDIGPFDDATVWANFEYFLRAVVPVAEEAGVVLALHPDDPPVPSIAGVARIIRSVEAYKRVIEMVPSPNNCLEFCQGTVAEMFPTAEGVYDAIRYFGSRKKIAYVHFRNVSGGVPGFDETFIDNGMVDMLEALRVYKEVGFEGVLIPDHVPGLVGDTPYGHGSQGYAIGYMKALIKAVNRFC